MQTLHIPLAYADRPFSEGPEVLLFYNGPQLFWLPFENRKLLAVALPDDAGKFPCLVVELTEAQAAALEANQLRVRSAVLAAIQKWVMRDYDAMPLVLEALESIPEHWLPGDVFLRLESEA